MYPKSLENLIEQLKVLPGVGQKTAERYAMSLLETQQEQVVAFSNALLEVKDTIRNCDQCHNLSDTKRCIICEDMTRNHSTLCVVANPKEVFSIEKSETYDGMYHVLGGLISTQKGILPDQLTIDSLVNRVKNEAIKEVILALNATVEGEMTALYISKKLEGECTITRLAFGLPIGGQLDYADDMTLLKAFEGRRKVTE